MYNGWSNKETCIVYVTLVEERFDDLLDCQDIGDIKALIIEHGIDFNDEKIDYVDIEETLRRGRGM